MVLERWPVPVVPVWIDGTFEAFPRSAVLPRPHRVRIVFGEPIDPRAVAATARGDAPRAIAEALRNAVLELAREHRG
jgi:1-acyl-sn-glycerol-3-phosphate acyltransferase